MKKVKIKQLTSKDIGRWVEYTSSDGKKEQGKIKGWNNEYIFVVYQCENRWDKFQDYTGVATNPENLKFID